MSYKVITHNGKAHMDEVLGIALLAIHYKEFPIEILRLSHEEISEYKSSNNIKEIFIDCGLKYDPVKGYFDHHQSGELPCAAKLVFDYYFDYLQGSDFEEYITLVSNVDTKGPKSLSDYSYKSDTAYYFGFSQRILLKKFEKDPQVVTELFYDGINEIIEFEKEKQEALKWLETPENSRIHNIDGITVLEYLNVPPKEIASGIKFANNDLIEENNIHLIYSYDKDNNSIRTIYRTVFGDNIVDLTQSYVKNQLFCHNNGFLLKFIPESTNEWINIIKESKMIKKIETDMAPKAIGPYSQGVIVNNIIYTSGQIALDPTTQELVDGDIEVQTKQVINNLEGILKSAGSDFSKVFKVTIFLSDMNNFAAVNTIYSEYFISKPARSTVEVSRLPKDVLIEIECIAEV